MYPLVVLAETLSPPLPPSFVQIAADPVRWGVLRELAHSDRRVRELCELVDRPQNLVSYHLGRLRAEGLVAGRRSSADGRDTYYVLDLARCRELLAASGCALHPGLRPAPPPLRTWTRQRGRRPRVLFLCTGNSARSQIAEALTEETTRRAVEARSAGSYPKPLHPNAVRVLRARGIDISGRRTKHLSEFTNEGFDYVVSLCDRVREVCPEFPEHPDLIHWSIPDPSRARTADKDTYPAFERTTDELAERIFFLLELIAEKPEVKRNA
jgi:ArsR family transcriptional regulator, arsenate/arsenite/antimonite-responsive transcriptional repressor / arsenate reductase (thioredoxin)